MTDGYSLPHAVANHRAAELQLRDLRQSLFNQYRHSEDLLGRLRTRQEDREGKPPACLHASSGEIVATDQTGAQAGPGAETAGAGRPEMKPRYTVALALPLKPCQRPGCLNLGRMRLQKHKPIIRSLYLCDGCVESLLPIDLNDLFVEFGAILKTRRGFHNMQAAAIVRSCSKPADPKVKLEIGLTIENR